ncbi:MAG: HD domain-containing protein, partial [Micromonosporaceae bacterium]
MLPGRSLRAVSALWAKTARDASAPSRWHPLLAHMWDSAATADWLWDWLPPSVRHLLGGDPGRELYRWLAALHDLGKASVAFQTKAPQLAAAVEAAGLPC